MGALRTLGNLLDTGDSQVKRVDEGWELSGSYSDVCGPVEHREVLSDAELLARPSVPLSAEALDDLARQLGRDPLTVPWARERRLAEDIARDDRYAVTRLLDGVDEPMPTALGVPLLTLALDAASWQVALELLARGAPLVKPPDTAWSPNDFAVASLDDSDGALAVLTMLLDRHLLDPLGGLLRQVWAPRVVRVLVDAGSGVDATGPSGGAALDGALEGATPLSVALIHGCFAVASALVACGAALDGRDQHGRSALGLSVYWGKEEPVRWLLERGASLDVAPDSLGRTPRSLAQKYPDHPSSRALLAAINAVPG